MAETSTQGVISSSVDPALADGLARLWVKFLPEIERRLSILDSAVRLSREHGSIAESQREEACSAAHKLAGILGTFGLDRGTELARKAEHLLAEHPAGNAILGLDGWVQELHLVIASR